MRMPEAHSVRPEALLKYCNSAELYSADQHRGPAFGGAEADQRRVGVHEARRETRALRRGARTTLVPLKACAAKGLCR